MEQIKINIINWAQECDIHPDDFEWIDQFTGKVDTSKKFICFAIANNAIMVKELQKLQEQTKAIHVNIIADNNKLNILVCYEKD